MIILNQIKLKFRSLSLFVAFFCFVNLSYGQDSLFIKANQLYSDGKYFDAIGQYEDILKNKNTSAALYFNLGNAYYKTGQNAVAILNYERALRLSPNDKDIQYNLKIARLKVVDRIESISVFFLNKWLDATIQLFGSNIWAYICLATFALTLILILVFLFSLNAQTKKLMFLFLFISLIISVFSYFASDIQKERATNSKTAIIFKASVTIYSTPSSNGTALFLLHEGTKVRIIEKLGSWYRIQLADGNDGWIEIKNLEII